MSKQIVTIEQVIKDLSEMFSVGVEFNEHKSRAFNGKYFINKQQYEREEVISKLVNYFNDKVIQDGMCDVHPITLIWTVFEIKLLPVG